VRRRKPTAALAAELLGRRSVTVLDVGARWGATGAWYGIAPLGTLVGFEPDPEEHARLSKAAREGEAFHAAALGAVDGPATLHVTKEPGCSSLLPPSADAIARYPLLEVMKPARDVPVTLTRLDTWARATGHHDVSVVKLDTQGTELDILKGAGALLDRVLAVECEVEFFPLYEGQPLFGDVDVYLRSRGLSLWRLSHLVHYSERHSDKLLRSDVAVFDGVTASFAAGGGRLAWGQAFFVRDPAGFDPGSIDGRRALLVLASLFDACGEVDALASILARLVAAPSCPEPWRKRLADHLRDVERESR
jgi:FkbM family methyltransferase